MQCLDTDACGLMSASSKLGSSHSRGGPQWCFQEKQQQQQNHGFTARKAEAQEQARSPGRDGSVVRSRLLSSGEVRNLRSWGERGVQPPVTLAPRDLTPSSGLQCLHSHLHIPTHRHLHIHKSKTNTVAGACAKKACVEHLELNYSPRAGRRAGCVAQ